MKIIIACESCDIEYSVHHQMDEKYYPIRFCPFCCEEIIDNQDYVVDADEEVEEEEHPDA